MVQDNAGNLYGVTYSGGTNHAGTVFKATLTGTLTTLYQFVNNPALGYNPYGGLIKGADGNFYGTTETYSTIFKITPAGVFTPVSSYFGASGLSLECSLSQGIDGNFYGAAGLKSFNQQGGAIFKCGANGAVTVLTQFNGTNGDQPYSGLVQATDGKFYGTTTGGGLYGDGTIFSVTTNGAFTKLLDFNGANGAFPFAPLIIGTDGNIVTRNAPLAAVHRDKERCSRFPPTAHSQASFPFLAQTVRGPTVNCFSKAPRYSARPAGAALMAKERFSASRRMDQSQCWCRLLRTLVNNSMPA